MAKNETSKSKAELYREERKARIAKAAKQNAKNIEKRKKASKAIKATVAVVLAVVIVGFAGFSIFKSSFTAVKIGDTKISASEFNYYYAMAYNYISNQAIQSEQAYGTNLTGFDTNIAPDQQETTDEDGNTITWADLIKERALSTAQQTIGYSNEAVAAGITLSEDQEAEINETIESLRDSAAEQNATLNKFLKFYYGINEKTLRKILKLETLAQNFTDDKQSEISNSITDDEIAKTYKENKKDYDYTDIRYYTISFKKLTAEKDESADALKKRQAESDKKYIADAKDILAKATDEKAFIEAVKAYNESKTDTTKKTVAAGYSTLESSITEDGAEWAFSADRKAGDVTVITGESAAYVVYCIKPAYNGNSINVRHCLIGFDAKDSANVTDEEKKAAFKDAEALLKGLGDKFTEDDFAKMAKENSIDEGSASNGGLYENVRISGNFVEEFEAWCFDPARKVGDTGIVETQHGYHIMYFSSNNKDDLDWKAAIKDEKANEELTAFQEDLFAEDGKNAIVDNKTWSNMVVKDYCDNIRKMQMYS